MIGRSLRRFKVYTPFSEGISNQSGGGIFRWSAPPPFLGTGVLGDISPQVGGGMKEMRQEFFKEVKKGVKI